MGHRLSKTTIADGSSNVAANDNKKGKYSSAKHTTTNADKSNSKRESNKTLSSNLDSSSSSSSSSSSGPTIKVITDSQSVRLETRSESSSSTNGSRQIIIKIQLLATMEPGENDATSSLTQQRLDATTTESNNNLNVERSNLTVNAISFQRNIACDQGSEVKLNNLNGGSSMILKNSNNNNSINSNNNNFVSNFTVEENSDEFRNGKNVQNLNILVQQMGNSQIINNVSDSRQGYDNNERTGNRSSTSSSEFSDTNAETFEEECSTIATGITTTMCAHDCKSHCCRRKKSPSPSAYPSKWSYCKCTCADVLKKIRPSCSKKQNQLPSSTSSSQISQLQPLAVPLPLSSELSRTANSHLPLWSSRGNDVIIPFASPQILVVQYQPASQVVQLASPIANLDQQAIRLMTGDLSIPRTPESTSSMSVSPCSTASSGTVPNGPIVHSQIDFNHCLVPDLDKITKSTYYWGKMDRYEAERLLEGKPEGTFLLRDSAQEEYLFSVTFRKYGRSLHARIEQFNHEFSFDCHDPGVFTAPTVTGLLEHYKDPTIVMFFEPMLTSPLHRNKTFSLQQLCRATIVSKTTYDGISELEIPIRLKSYLKEYHYKQRVRVKPFDESFYNCA